MRISRPFTLFLLLLAVIASGGCCKYKDIKVTSYDVASVTPKGLKAADLSLDLGLDNPAMGFKLTRMEVQVYRNGVSLGTVYADPVRVRPRTVAVYRVDGHVELGPAVSLFQLASWLSHFKAEEYTVDVKARVKLRSGIAKMLDMEDVSLDELLNKNE